MNAITQIKAVPNLDNMVSFMMGGEVLALPSSVIREIIEPPHITPVPLADIHSPGLINNRGNVIPITDLRPVFGMVQKPFDLDTRIMVIEIEMAEGPMVVGLIAEKVDAVISLDPAMLRPVAAVGSRWPAASVAGVGRWDGHFVHILNIERIFEDHLGIPGSLNDCEKIKTTL